MKILYVITGLGMGGAEQIVINLAEQALLKGHEVSIVYLTGEVQVYPISDSIKLIGVNIQGYKGFIRAFTMLKNIIIDFKPDVVHSHMVHANLLARLVRLIIPIPKLICTAHSSNEGGVMRMLAYRLTHSLADFTTNVSRAAAISLEQKGAAPKGEMLAIANGVDTEYFKPQKFGVTDRQNNDSFNLITVGRLEKVKSYPILLNAISLLLERGHKIKLTIIGDGTQKQKLLNITNDLALSENVEWMGIRHDIPILLSKANAFVIASTYEGFGLVAAEAMSCQLPVISTDNGGVGEILGDSHWLVSINNPQALADKIAELIGLSESERLSIGIQNRERVVEYFSLNKMFEKYMDLYQF